MVCWAHAGIITVILCSVLCASEAHAQFCTSNGMCADTKPCTVDTCNLATHQCRHVSTCDDGNACTTNTCTTSGCTYPAKPNFSSCDLDQDICSDDYCMSGTCRPGGAPVGVLEACSNGVDEDCDGLTDEHEPAGAVSCRGPEASTRQACRASVAWPHSRQTSW